MDTVVVVAACFHIKSTRIQGRQTANIERPIIAFRAMISDIPEQFFCGLYRMPFRLFAQLFDVISSHSGREQLREKHSCWIKLSITLRWLAGGSYLDIALLHNVSALSIYYYIDNTLQSINDNLEISFPSSSISWLEDVSKYFRRRT